MSTLQNNIAIFDGIEIGIRFDVNARLWYQVKPCQEALYQVGKDWDIIDKIRPIFMIQSTEEYTDPCELYITEYGLYRLTDIINTKRAVQFRKWMIKDVGVAALRLHPERQTCNGDLGHKVLEKQRKLLRQKEKEANREKIQELKAGAKPIGFIPDEAFEGKVLIIKDHEGRRWFKSVDLAKFLGYVQYKGVLRLKVDPNDTIRFERLRGCVDSKILGSRDDLRFMSEEGMMKLVILAEKKQKARELKTLYLG